MSAAPLARRLARLERPSAVLAPDRTGKAFAIYASGDRRRRPGARIGWDELRRLVSEGVLAARPEGEGYVLTPAGRSWLRRQAAAPDEAFAAQHGDLVDRPVAYGPARVAMARGYEFDPVLRRLAALRNAHGAHLLDDAELAAAAALRQDWLRGAAGLYRGVDWRAPPRGAAPRGVGDSAEARLAAGCDARARLAAALAGLLPAQRRAVEALCLLELSLAAAGGAGARAALELKRSLKAGLAAIAAARARTEPPPRHSA